MVQGVVTSQDEADQDPYCTVLDCTVLYCTVLYCILTSHEDEGAAGYEADQGAGGEEVETLCHGAAPVLRHRLGTGNMHIGSCSFVLCSGDTRQTAHRLFMLNFCRVFLDFSSI